MIRCTVLSESSEFGMFDAYHCKLTVRAWTGLAWSVCLFVVVFENPSPKGNSAGQLNCITSSWINQSTNKQHLTSRISQSLYYYYSIIGTKQHGLQVTSKQVNHNSYALGLVSSVMCISVIEHFVTSYRAPAIVLGFLKTTISAIKVF